MLRRFVSGLTLVVCLLLAAAASAQDDFTVVVLPDTQIYADRYPDTFTRQTAWIAANEDALNIKFVAHVGDIVNDAESTVQWTLADQAARTLDTAGIPYAWAIGNHDYQYEYPLGRNAEAFNRYFGPARYTEYAWYGEQYPAGSNENFYTTFSAGEQQYLVLVLEMHPRDAAIAWASSVLDRFPEHLALLVTHSFMFYDDTRVDTCDANDVSGGGNNNPEALWEKLVRKHANIAMVLSGHITRIGTGRRADLGEHGNLINQMLSDFQDWTNGGDGYLRILKFRPALNQVEVRTYSPTLDSYLEDDRNQFTVDLRRPASSGTGVSALAGKVRTPRPWCKPVAAATITATDGRVATTDDAGYYRLEVPAPQSHSAVAAKEGWESTATASAFVPEGYPAQLDFYLTAPPVEAGPCIVSAMDPSVTICSPFDGQAVTSPFKVTAQATSTSPVKYMQVYVKGVKVFHIDATSTLETTLDLVPGAHRITVVAKNTEGTVFQQTVRADVTEPAAPPPCGTDAADPSIAICDPAENATVSSPFQLVAQAVSSSPIKFVQVYVDGVKNYETPAATLDIPLNLSSGAHRINVLAKNSAGQTFNKVLYVTVAVADETKPCQLSVVNPSVTICTPTHGSVVSSPVRVVAATTSSSAVSFLQVYVDGLKAQDIKGGRLDVLLPLTSGAHRIVVQGKNSAGTLFKQAVNITVQ